VDLARGELIFPSLRPFDSQPLNEQIPQLYDSNDDRTRREASRYIVRASLKSRLTRIRLGQLNILEGTEVVLIDGVKQTRGTDYNINYMTGEVTFLTDRASNPAADLSIDYEYEPFFSFEQKTLLGLRGEYKFWNEQSSAGATLLFNSERSPDERVRVGREPTRGILWDADMNLRFEPELLTRAVNALPLIHTDAPSRITLTAEIARNYPNPNTRGKAFIDDFEGSGNRSSLGILRGMWTRASVPKGVDQEDRGRLVWYNPWNRIPVTDIWPNRKVSAQDNLVNILVFAFAPNQNASWSTDSWGGVMRAFRGGGNDFSRSKFIEIWAKGDQGILKIDLGSISEDAWTTGTTQEGRPSKGNLNTEDELVYGQRDGILQDDEDVGLDGLADEQEPGYDAAANPDPSGDNWRYDKTHVYDWINGTERNRNDPDRRDRPDTEDINNNGLLDTKNDYYEYALNLSEDPFVEGTEHDGWRLFRIPLWGQNSVKVGNPDSTRMEYVRLWITRTDSVAKVQIAQIEIVGNDWLELGLEDLKAADGGSFDVTVKNTQDNDDYETPPGVHEEIDPLTNIPKKEQSLVLQLKDMKPGHRAMVYKTFSKAENYTTYNTMKMFVHGDPALEAVGDSLVFFLQFGADTTNMYEYRGRLHSGWPENSMSIDLAELTRLKFDLLTARADSAVTVTDTTRGRLHVRGNPSLSNIKMLVLGVENRSGTKASGEVWFDELRLDDVRTDAGTAVRGDISVSVADLLGLSVDYTHKTSEFRTLTAKDGGGNTETSYGLRGDLKLGRFLPRAWGVSLPVGFSYGESTKLPRLKPGSDIVLSQEQQDVERTWNVRKTGNVSFRKTASNQQGWNGVLPFLMGLTLNRINTNFSFSENESRSPERPFSLSRSYNGSFRYDLSPKKRRSVKLWSWLPTFVPGSLEKSEFFYLPSTLRMQVRGDKKKSEYMTRAAKDPTKQKSFRLSDTYTLSLRPWNSLSSNYDLSIKRDLRTNLDPAKLQFGDEINRNQTASLTFDPNLLKWLKQSYSYRTKYQENNDPKLRGAATENLGRSVNSDATSEAKFTLELSRLLGPLVQPRKSKNKREKPKDESKKSGEKKDGKQGDIPDEKGGIPEFLSPHLLLGKVLDAVGPVTASWSHTDKSAVSGLLDRPVWGYQFGLSDDPEVEVTTTTATQKDARSTSNRSQWATSLNLSSNLSLKPKYSYEHTFSRSSSRSEDTRSQTFPGIGLRLSGLERWPLLSLMVRSSSLSSNYERKWSRRGVPKAEGGQIEPLSEETAHNFSPLFAWSLQWKGGVKSSLKGTWKRSERKDFRGSGGTTEKQDFDLTASIDYRFEPKGRRLNLLFWKNVRLKSHLDLSMDISYKHNYQAHGVGDEKAVPRDDRTTWSIKPNASYRFSNTFTGGAKIEVRRARNNLRERVDNSIEVGVWGEIRLN
jgi:cell surface protein SprA